MNRDKKFRVGFYTDATGYGGSEHHLGLVMSACSSGEYSRFLFRKQKYSTNHLANIGKFEDVCVDSERSEYSQEPIAQQKTDDRLFSFFGRIKSRMVVAVNSTLRSIWRSVAPDLVKLLVGEYFRSRKLSTLFSRYDLDCMYVSQSSPVPDLVSLAARSAGVPQIVTRFAALPESGSGRAPLKTNLLTSLTMYATSVALFNTQYNKNSWLRVSMIKPRSVSVVPNGLDLAACENSEASLLRLRAEFGIDPDDFIVGLTARFDPMKGHYFLLKAVAKLLQEKINVKLLLVGDGDSTVVRAQAKGLGIADRVIYAGHRKDVMQITALYDIATLPSVANETFGFVNLEAMASRKPIVASRFSGIPEVVQDGVTGTLVSPGSEEELYSALKDFYESPVKRANFGDEGYKRVTELFSLSKMQSSILEIIREPSGMRP